MAKGSMTAPGPLTAAIAEILRDAFLELFISQARFGELLGGMPQSTVSIYLRGEHVMDMELFLKTCRVLNLDPLDVFSTALRRI